MSGWPAALGRLVALHERLLPAALPSSFFQASFHSELHGAVPGPTRNRH